MRALNAKWRGKDKPTNVLSFPMADERDLEQANVADPELLLGDIILARGVCEARPPRKASASSTMRRTCSSTARFTCSATTIMTTREAADMEAREVRALARLGIANPYEVTA